MKRILLTLAFVLLGAGFFSFSSAAAADVGCVNYSGASYIGSVVLSADGTVIGCNPDLSGDADIIPLSGRNAWSGFFQGRWTQFDTRLGFGCDDCWIAMDGENGSQGIPIGFDINWYGTMYDTIFVNSNGSISFGGGSSSYDQPLNEILGTNPGVCAYCLDLENRSQLTDSVVSWNSGTRHTDFIYWGRTTFEGRPAFVTTWMNIPTYSSSNAAGLWNTFQIMLVDVDDGNDDVNVIINYGSMRNENDQGYDGNHVAIGLGNVSGSATIYNSIVDNSGLVLNGMTTDQLWDNGDYPLNTLSLNSEVPGRFIFHMEGGMVEGSTVDLGPGCTDADAINYLSGASSDDGSCKYPVINLLATGAIGQIDISWNEPMSGNLSNLDSYTITYSPGNGELTGVDKTLSGYALSGLSNGTLYTINVCAVYDMGGGDLLSVCEDTTATTAAPVASVGFGGGGGGGGGGSISGPGRNSPTSYPTIPLVGTVKITEPVKPIVIMPPVAIDPVKQANVISIEPAKVFNPDIPDDECFKREDITNIIDSTTIVTTDEFKTAFMFLNAYDMTMFNSMDAFEPFGSMTRQQAAKMFSNFAMNVLCRKPSTDTVSYTDMGNADPSLTKYITLAFQLGLMKGSDNQFRPNEFITKAELNAVLTRLILKSYLPEDQGVWYAVYNDVATKLGIITQGAGLDPVSRHDAALMLFRAYKDQAFAKDETDSSYVIIERTKYIAR